MEMENRVWKHNQRFFLFLQFPLGNLSLQWLPKLLILLHLPYISTIILPLINFNGKGVYANFRAVQLIPPCSGQRQTIHIETKGFIRHYLWPETNPPAPRPFTSIFFVCLLLLMVGYVNVFLFIFVIGLLILDMGDISRAI